MLLPVVVRVGRGERIRGDLESFKADPANPLTWTGVERADRIVLEDAIASGRLNPSRMFTGVYCGCVPAGATSRRGRLSDEALQGIYCFRVDLVAVHDGEWLAVEIKPRLTVESIGQALVYRHLLPIWYRELGGIKGAVLCETARAELCDCSRMGGGVRVIAASEFDETTGELIER